jgi:hypothetical protein
MILYLDDTASVLTFSLALFESIPISSINNIVAKICQAHSLSVVEQSECALKMDFPPKHSSKVFSEV